MKAGVEYKIGVGPCRKSQSRELGEVQDWLYMKCGA